MSVIQEHLCCDRKPSNGKIVAQSVRGDLLTGSIVKQL